MVGFRSLSVNHSPQSTQSELVFLSQNRPEISCFWRCNSLHLHEENKLLSSNNNIDWYFPKKKTTCFWESYQGKSKKMVRLIAESSAWTSLGRRRGIADLFVMFIACTSQKASNIHKTFVSKLAIVLISKST